MKRITYTVNYLKGEIILLPYPFTDLVSNKVRPAVIVSSDKGKYEDLFVVPLTSKIQSLSDGEFCLQNWKETGLNVPTAVKRGCILIDSKLIIKKVGSVSEKDNALIRKALCIWFEL